MSGALVQQLNAELAGAYPEPGANHFGLDADEVSPGRGAIPAVLGDGTPVGCGALRMLDAETGELKRMYVSPAARGTGWGGGWWRRWRRRRGRWTAPPVLETGTRQHAALALYRATGFVPIPLYGQCLLSPDTSICKGRPSGALN